MTRHAHRVIRGRKQTEHFLEYQEERLLAERAIGPRVAEAEKAVQVLAETSEAGLEQPPEIVLFEEAEKRPAINIKCSSQDREEGGEFAVTSKGPRILQGSVMHFTILFHTGRLRRRSASSLSLLNSPLS